MLQLFERARVFQERVLPEKSAALSVHREKPSLEGLAEKESFVAVAPPDIVGVGDGQGSGDAGVEGFPDVTQTFVVSAQGFMRAAEFNQVLRLFLEGARMTFERFDAVFERLGEQLNEGGNHTDLTVFGPGHELTSFVFHHTQHLNERFAGIPARPHQGTIRPWAGPSSGCQYCVSG